MDNLCREFDSSFIGIKWWADFVDSQNLHLQAAKQNIEHREKFIWRKTGGPSLTTTHSIGRGKGIDIDADISGAGLN